MQAGAILSTLQPATHVCRCAIAAPAPSGRKGAGEGRWGRAVGKPPPFRAGGKEPGGRQRPIQQKTRNVGAGGSLLAVVEFEDLRERSSGGQHGGPPPGLRSGRVDQGAAQDMCSGTRRAWCTTLVLQNCTSSVSLAEPTSGVRSFPGGFVNAATVSASVSGVATYRSFFLQK